MRRAIAARVGALSPFLAMEVMERAFEMERDGAEIAHLEIGEPDGGPPAAAVEACHRALDRGETRYSDSRGLVPLREAIARDMADRAGVEVSPERVIVTSGSSPAMLLAFSLLLEPGDEVVYAEPGYACYPNFIRYCGGRPVPVPSDPARGYALDVDAVRRAVGRRTKAILINSPANPTGSVESATTLRALAALGVPLLSDEIYAGLVYDGAECTPVLSVAEDAFVFDGFSKRYAMTGFRLGHLIAPEWAIRDLQVMQQNLFISANRFVQHAGIAALQHGEPDVAARRERYASRRERLVAGLRELGFGVPQLPVGAFYVLADAARFGLDSKRLAFELLERARVGTTPGIDFGAAGEGKLRFCFAVSDATIDTALERLAPVLAELEDVEAERRARAGDAAEGSSARGSLS